MKLHFDWYKGLGTSLCAFSTFVNSELNLLKVPASNHPFFEFKHLFQINDNLLKLESYENQLDDSSNFINPNDFFKLFNKYFTIEKSKKERHYVGLALYSSPELMFDYTNLDMDYPNIKFYPIEIYQLLITKIKSWGYDIITFDSKDISLKTKIDLIKNNCEFVVGYEGGISHLAHMLDTPCFILPWRNNSCYPELLHLDLKTYFCTSINEILNWKIEELHYLLENLKNNNTNNKFLKGNLILKEESPGFFSIPNIETDFYGKLLGEDELFFIDNFIQTKRLGGF